MTDSRNFTVLTYAAYRDETNCFKILFEYALKHIERKVFSNVTITEWVNFTTDDNFTALHFATKHGNYTMLHLLVERAAADLSIKNKFGATVMHIAAQQDQPLSLYYLNQ
jgi:ankyrin repeat protein